MQRLSQRSTARLAGLVPFPALLCEPGRLLLISGILAVSGSGNPEGDGGEMRQRLIWNMNMFRECLMVLSSTLVPRPNAATIINIGGKAV